MLVLARKCSRCGELYEKESENRDVNGFIFVHISEKDTSFKDGPYNLCPDCMSNLNTWFYGRKINEDKKNKKELTLKDMVAYNDPHCIDVIYEAGVAGCPSDYSYLNISKRFCLESNSHPSHKNCIDCWNRPFKKKEVDA